MQITSTLWGMEQYFNYKSQSLFQDILLPDGVNKRTLVNTILVEAGELEIMYPNGDFLKVAIDTWFDRKYQMLERWVKAINTDYKPLENYNRTEKWSLTANGSTANTGTKNATTTNTGSKDSTTSNTGSKNSTVKDTDKDTGSDTTSGTESTTTSDSTTVGAQTSTDETQVSAFNSSGYSPSEKVSSNVGGRTDSSSGTGKVTNSNTLTRSNTAKITEETGDTGTTSNDSTREGNAYGNIGVTTSQQMLKEEIELWANIDIYREAAEMFVQEFCIPVY